MSSQRVVAAPVDLDATFKPGMFNGKVLFCTGGGSGICKGMTEAIMKYGASAAIVGRKLDRLEASAKELASKTGQKCIAIQADVRTPAQLQAAAKRTVEELGKIDFVICGAAGNFMAPISGISENAFRTVLEIDTLGTYNTVKATLPYVRQTHGSYIHVSATRHYRGVQYQAHMSAAKAAVDATSQCLAVEEGPFGVRSNVIAPGPITGTEGMDRLSRKGPDASNTYSHVPLGRAGAIADVAAAGVFLFSPAASWVTGTIMVVDGGERHMSRDIMPYPQATLDPASVKHMIAAKL